METSNAPNEKNKVKGTLLTHETPFTPENSNQYEYPFPDKINKDLYDRYKVDAEKLKMCLSAEDWVNIGITIWIRQ